jgi:hypothetical protein
MIRIVIERWKHLDGSTRHLWSVWRDGKRVAMGKPRATPEEAEAEAQAACQNGLGRPADSVERL